MANYLSQLDQYNEVQSPLNIDLIGKVMQAKQGKYDQNLAKIDETLSQLKVQENLLVRQEDKEYFANTVQSLIDTVNRSGKMNITSNGLTRQITGQIKNVLDDEYILNQIGNSTKIRNFYSEIEKLKEKNDGRYNDVNFQYAIDQAGLEQYMSGETSDVKSFSYKNYVDVNKTTAEKIKQFKDLRGDEVVEVRDGAGGIQKRTVKGLTSSEIIAFMPQILSPEERAQLEINGWTKFRGEGGLEQATKTAQLYSNNVLSNMEKNIKDFQTLKNNSNLSQQERDRYAELEEVETRRKTDFENNITAVIGSQNLSKIAGFLETDSWMANFSKMAGAKVSIEYEADSAFFQAAKLELDLADEARKQEKHPLEMAKLKKEAGLAEGSASFNIERLPEEQIAEQNTYGLAVTDFNEKVSEMKQIVNGVMESNNIDDATKEIYRAEYNRQIEQGAGESVASKRAFEKTVGNKYPEIVNKLAVISAEKNALAKVISKADDVIVQTFNTNPDKYLKDVENKLKFLELEEQKTSVRNTAMKGAEYFQKGLSVVEPLLGTGLSGLIGDISRVKTEELKEHKELKKLVDEYGGMAGFKKVMNSNPDKALIKKVSELTERINTTMYNSGTSISLKNDAIKNGRNDVVANEGQGIIKTLSVATLTKKEDREKLASAITQTDGQINFDINKPITITPQQGGNFLITQARGVSESRQGTMTKAPATFVITPENDLYGWVRENFETGMSRRQITASNYKEPVKNEKIQFLEASQKSSLNKAANFVLQTVGSAEPAYFLSKEGTKKIFEGSLTNIPKEKVNTLISLMTTNPTEKFNVEAVPDRGQWDIKVNIKNKKGVFPVWEESTGKQKMDEQLIMYIKQYPQIQVASALLNYLKENPTEIDNVLARLR